MTYLICGLVGIVSPFFALAEPLAVLSGLSTQVNWMLMAFSLALGQSVGFSIMYFFGEQIVARWRWFARKLSRVNLDEYTGRRNTCTFLAACFGLPPLTALALGGPFYEPRFIRFISVSFCGRLVRFSVLAGAATFFSKYVDQSVMPDWLLPYF